MAHVLLFCVGVSGFHFLACSLHQSRAESRCFPALQQMSYYPAVVLNAAGHQNMNTLEVSLASHSELEILTRKNKYAILRKVFLKSFDLLYKDLWTV